MDTSGPTTDAIPQPPESGAASHPDYWFALIDEKEAGRFLGFSVRHMQGLRYKGGGPKFIRLSSRCIRYRRADLRQWAEARLRTSTSDSVPEAA